MEEERNIRTASFPSDSKSLYNQKIYDTQNAHRKCYSEADEGSVQVIEGFGRQDITLKSILKFAIFVVVVVLGLLIADNLLEGKLSRAVGIDVGSTSKTSALTDTLSDLNLSSLADLGVSTTEA
jgi:hypothetical protein